MTVLLIDQFILFKIFPDEFTFLQADNIFYFFKMKHKLIRLFKIASYRLFLG